jgi:succinyl-CoA synthetase beta subunit
VIRLLEHQGKALLARNGVRIPRGVLHPGQGDLQGALVVKAQVLAGGRGKAGGIKFAGDLSEAESLARSLMGAKIGPATVEAVYIEERLEIVREYYVCAMVDRDLGLPVILASPDGGVEIEAVAADRILRSPVDPLIGLRPYAVEEIVRFLDPPESARASLGNAISSLYAALLKEDAELIEVNPLAVLKDGSIVAADAKCVLDEDAAYRHEGRSLDFDGTPFEIAARKLGTIGIEMQGNIAAIMNGAGMTMATLDQLVSLGGQPQALIELHGAPVHGPERVAEIIKLVCTLEPRVLLINVYYQLRSIEIIARGLILARDRDWLAEGCRIVVRFRGEKESESRTLLADVDCTVTGAFDEACALAVKYAREPPIRGVSDMRTADGDPR